MTSHLPHAFRIERGGSPTLRASGRRAGAPGRSAHAESTRGIDIFPSSGRFAGREGIHARSTHPIHRRPHVMSSAAALTEPTLAQRRKLLKMPRGRGLVRGWSQLPPIEPAAREGRLPLSCARERPE
jgi:hypothetical protein